MSTQEISEASLRPPPLLSCAHRSFQALELATITSHRNRVQPCSAYTGEHLVDGLDWLVRDVAARIYYGSARVQQEMEGRGGQIAALGRFNAVSAGSVPPI